MGKIVALIASPVIGGNSDTITNAIIDGAMGLSTNEIILQRLDKIRFAHGCKACMGCKKTGKCVQNDEICDILDQITNSDAVIVSTPVYFGNPSSQYKTLEDRLFSFLNPDLSSKLPKGKKAIIVVSCSAGVELANKVADDIAKTYKALGFEILDIITFSDAGGKLSASKDGALLEKAVAIGKKLRNN